MKADFHGAKKIFTDPLASADDLCYTIGIFFGRGRFAGANGSQG